MRIGIDLMGSGTPPQELLEGVLAALAQIPPALSLHFLGTPDLFSGLKTSTEVAFYPVEEVIEMEDLPLTAIRKKKRSSLVLGIQMLKNQQLDAFISAGNTGALLASAKLQLKSLPHVRRPALITLLPTQKAPLAVLDVGANLFVKAEHLVTFAYMGAVYQQARGIAHPKVGLLNIGTEKGKGTVELKKAYQKLPLIEKIGAHFVGNVEARNAFDGNLDVLVSDGFTGNVFLKTTEGIGLTLLRKIEEELKNQTPSTLRKSLQYSEYPGALFIGVEELLIKCHGNPTSNNLIQTVLHVNTLLNHNLLENLKAVFTKGIA